MAVDALQRRSKKRRSGRSRAAAHASSTSGWRSEQVWRRASVSVVQLQHRRGTRAKLLADLGGALRCCAPRVAATRGERAVGGRVGGVRASGHIDSRAPTCVAAATCSSRRRTRCDGASPGGRRRTMASRSRGTRDSSWERAFLYHSLRGARETAASAEDARGRATHTHTHTHTHRTTGGALGARPDRAHARTGAARANTHA